MGRYIESIAILLLYEKTKYIKRKKEERNLSATISNGQKSDGSRSTSETSSHGSEPR